jgi:hypothetical protein
MAFYASIGKKPIRLSKAESPNLIHDCSQQRLARQFPMLPQEFN